MYTLLSNSTTVTNNRILSPFIGLPFDIKNSPESEMCTDLQNNPDGTVSQKYVAKS